MGVWVVAGWWVGGGLKSNVWDWDVQELDNNLDFLLNLVGISDPSLWWWMMMSHHVVQDYQPSSLMMHNVFIRCRDGTGTVISLSVRPLLPLPTWCMWVVPPIVTTVCALNWPLSVIITTHGRMTIGVNKRRRGFSLEKYSAYVYII